MKNIDFNHSFNFQDYLLYKTLNGKIANCRLQSHQISFLFLQIRKSNQSEELSIFQQSTVQIRTLNQSEANCMLPNIMNIQLNDDYSNLDFFRISAKSGLFSTMVIFLVDELFHLGFSPKGQLISEEFFTIVFKYIHTPNIRRKDLQLNFCPK